MGVLEDVLSAGLLGMLAVPGFVFIALRSLLRGPRGTQDTELSSRIATSLLVSVIFNAGYLIAASLVLGETQLAQLLQEGDDIAIRSPLATGIGVLTLGILVPAFLALLLYYRAEWRASAPPWPAWLKYPVRKGGYRNFPTAWDRAAPGLGGTFVRVRLPEGRWIGGWYSGESFISTYPQPRDIYIEKQYVMTKSGQFKRPVDTSAGVWLGITDGHIVEWIGPTAMPLREGEGNE